MCSISGCFLPRPAATLGVALRLSGMLRDIIIRAEDRGRDSCGVVAIGKGIQVHRAATKASDMFESTPAIIRTDTKIVLNNNRAEPTTEWIHEKSNADIQPFINGNWVVAHNGTIANDKALAEQYQLPPLPTKIDTAVLPAIFEKLWGGEAADLAQLARILNDEVIGSYALAIASISNPHTLYLACNYKPLYLMHDRETDAIFFTSLETYLEGATLNSKLIGANVVAIPPYTLVALTTRGKRLQIQEFSLTKPTPQRALIIHSGGLDSTVVASQALRAGYEIKLLHFKYQCRAERQEVFAVENLAKWFGCEALFVETDLFKDVIGHSRLTNTGDQLVTERGGEASAEFAHEWVPARNLIMLSVATGIAEAHGYSTIMLGNNLEEAGAYPDNEMEFVRRVNHVLPYATNLHKHVRLEMPVGNLMKHEIVAKGIELGTPFKLTWSCYEGKDRHCGTCGPCYMRKVAFKMRGIVDPAFIHEVHEPFWEGCDSRILMGL